MKDLNGDKILITEDDIQKASKTKLTEQSEEAVCRICLCTETEDAADSDKNPLISPCKCAGTMGMIHLLCLRHWLETKCTKKMHKGQTTYKFNKLDCELCKQYFPFKIAYKN